MSVLIGAHFPVASTQNIDGYTPDAGDTPGTNFVGLSNHDGYHITIDAGTNKARSRGGANCYAIIDTLTAGRVAASVDLQAGTSGNRGWVLVKGNELTTSPNDTGFGTTWSSYGFIIRPDTGQGSISFLTPSGFTHKATFPISSFSGTTTHRYTLEYLVGGQLNAYEDGALVGSYNDTADTFGTGTVVGFGQAAYVANDQYWDDFLVSTDGQFDFSPAISATIAATLADTAGSANITLGAPQSISISATLANTAGAGSVTFGNVQSLSVAATLAGATATASVTLVNPLNLSSAALLADTVSAIDINIAHLNYDIMYQVINPYQHPSLIHVLWENQGQGDLAQPLDKYSNYDRYSIQVTGIFSGASISLMGSIDDIHYEILHDSLGNPLTFTAEGIKDILEIVPYMKPVITAAAALTKLSTSLFLDQD